MNLPLKMQANTIALLLLVLSITSCHKDKTTGIERPTLVISSFIFETQYNAALVKSYPLVISGETVSGKITPSTTKTLVASFLTTASQVLVNNAVQESTKTAVDFSNPVVYTLVSAEGVKKNYTISVNWIYDIPHIYITTENNAPITSKDDYLQATIKIEGNGGYADFTASTKIKGRGNTTWGMPKKPYRLKLDSKASLFGLAQSKNWVMLANFLDPTLMLNSVAMKTGQLLDMPYTNHMLPVDVTINNVYAGSYAFTEQVEVASSRVAIEDGGVLLELDQNFDEPWEFKSAKYDLPVMVKSPELTDASQLVPIQYSFQQLENLVAASDFPNNGYGDHIDITSLVNYFIVYNLTDNEEINHPKSTYMYKPKNGKFFMGPIWDFDWAYGYEGTFQHFSSYNASPFWSANAEQGTFFFSRFLADPAVKLLYKKKWTAFKADKLPLLLQYVDEYGLQLETSRADDFRLWQTGGGNFKSDVLKLRSWLQNRANFIDTYTAGW